MSQARAPYNFIPLPADKQAPIQGERVSHDRYHTGKHTGYFDVTLKTVTPLFVRGMVTTQELVDGKEAKDQPEPFTLDGKPVIPGASLRGMIRNLVEIITFGKMHFVSSGKLAYRSMHNQDALSNSYRKLTTDNVNGRIMYPSERMQGGYLQKGDSESGWVIQPAKTHRGESIALVKQDDVQSLNISEAERDRLKTYPVGVKPSTNRLHHTGKNGVKLNIAQANGVSSRIGNGYESATLIISNTVGRIHGKGSNRTWYPAIYEADINAEPIPISQSIWNDFVKDRDLNRGIANRRIEKQDDVLFYLLDSRGELLFFGPTMFFRVPYENSISDLIPMASRDSHFTDYADVMFGYVSDDGNQKRDPVAYAGRVSVTSATICDGQTDVFYGEEDALRRTPGSPKPTTFQHYLEQPEGTQTRKEKLHHYGSKGARIRGHKLYWRQNVNIQHLQQGNTDGSKENVETTFHPVKEGISFSFRVYFENLTDAELGALAWALSLDNDESQYHMIGMGKPYGLGVVKLQPTLFITDRQARYRQLFDDAGNWHEARTEADPKHYVEAFKSKLAEHNINFDEDERIKQLHAMLRLYDPDDELFTYMTIEPNEYKDRPVLPRPEEVEEAYKAKDRERQHQKVNALKRRVTQSGLVVGDIISGKTFDSSDGVWFEPKKIKLGENEYNISSLTDIQYEAYMPAGNILDPSANPIYGRIIEIQEGDPVEIICEQVE